MSNPSPTIEVLPRLPEPAESVRTVEPTLGRQNRRRLLIFTVLFLLGCVLGLTYTFSRPALYSSAATLLIAPPAAFDSEDAEVAKAQYVRVQRQVLLSQPVLTALQAREPVVAELLDGAPEPLPALRNMLDVTVIEDANMVELQAQGSQRALLPDLVNGWVEVYLDTQVEDQQAASNDAVAALRRQLDELEPRVAAKRAELDAFRKRYDIVSMERDENEVLSRLKGLNESLVEARAEAAKAAADLSAVKQALAQGWPVPTQENNTELDALIQEAADLRGQLQALNQRFTRKYLELNPDTLAMMERLDILDELIAQRQQDNQRIILAQAEQAYASARQNVTNLEQQLAEYKATAMDFTTRFTQHRALEEDLVQLEALYRQVQDRLVQQEVTSRDEQPQVRVLNLAVLPDSPVYPHYLRDAGLSVAGAIMLGFIGVWFYEFFNRTPARTESRSYFYSLFDPRVAAPPLAQSHPETLTADSPAQRLPPRLPRELSAAEIQALLSVADPAGRVLICALLSGLTVKEITELRWQHIDRAAGTLQTPGRNARRLSLSGAFKEALDQLASAPPAADASLWQDETGAPLEQEELMALLACLAHDAGLVNPDEITPQLLRHTYLAFLVRQGVRLSELGRVAGPLSPTALAAYGALSPPGQGVLLEQIDAAYPALRS